MTVGWNQPASDGACPVTSYALFIDDGATGTPTIEINTANDPAIRNQPTLRQATITTLSASDLGKDYALKLVATTARGDFSSETVTIRFATVPQNVASTAPVEDSAKTSASQVTVKYAAPTTGGSPVLGYHLQYGVGIAGGFSDLLAANSNSMATSYSLTQVEKGQTYYFRFRVRNMYGWSDFSSTGYITASEVPARSNPPAVSAFSTTAISLTLDLSVESMGSSVTAYELYWATGVSPTAFAQLTSYDGTSSVFTFPSGSDAALTAGAIYHFKLAARNTRGLGEQSTITSIAATDLLSAPTGLTRTAGTETRIFLSWDASTPINSPGDDILGYRLYLQNQETGTYDVIFDGQKLATPAQTAFAFSPPQFGSKYVFKVSVLTFNGESPLSAAFTTYA